MDDKITRLEFIKKLFALGIGGVVALITIPKVLSTDILFRDIRNTNFGGSNVTSTGAGIFNNVTETSPTLVKLNQYTPQSIINGYPINATEPEFTYTDGALTKVEYPSGFYKELAYNVDGSLNTITYSNGTVKTMVWVSESLDRIEVT
jgi:hypothetical protein